MSGRRRVLRRLGVAGIAVLLVGGVLLARAWRAGETTTVRATPPDASTVSSERVKVEVLNATDVRGLARRATLYLRDRGFDVLYLGTATTQLDSTLVLWLSDHLWRFSSSAAASALRMVA